MTPSLQEDIIAANVRVQVATQRYMRLLAEVFPVGATVRVKLCVHQVKPSLGKVTGFWGDGLIGVRLVKPTRFGRHTVKRVHWSRVTTTS